MAPAEDPSSEFQLVVAPVGIDYERNGWGGVRILVTLGLLFNIAVQVQDGEVTDPNIDAYELFVDQVCTWLMKFGILLVGVSCARTAAPARPRTRVRRRMVFFMVVVVGLRNKRKGRRSTRARRANSVGTPPHNGGQAANGKRRGNDALPVDV